MRAVEWIARPRRWRGGALIRKGLTLGKLVGWRTLCAPLPAFAAYVCRRFRHDNCLSVAGSLSYTSLLALVPLAAVGFAMLAAFPVFEDIRHDIQNAVFEHFLPATAEQTKSYFEGFVSNAKQLTAVGIIGLAVTAVLLLGTIESTFNLIFRVERERPLISRFLVFWAVITLGPLLVGASFSLGTYLFAAGRGVAPEIFQGAIARIALALPTLIMVVALTLFYVVIPHRPVMWTHAAAGGVVAGLLFTALRYGFSIYVASFPTYQAIYGAISALPIFLVWMYLSWAVVLLGAVITAGLPEWHATQGRRSVDHSTPGGQFVLLLQVLSMLFAKSARGERARRSELVRVIGAREQTVAAMLGKLEAAGYISLTARNEWVLVRDLATVSIDEFLRDLRLTLRATDIAPGSEAWRQKIVERLGDAARQAHPALAASLREILAEDGIPGSATRQEANQEDDGTAVISGGTARPERMRSA